MTGRILGEHLREAAVHYGAFGFFVGFLFGMAYGLGGLVVDAMTTGLNTGTALALNAIWAMPFLFAPLGVVAGVLWAPIAAKIPSRFGGSAD